VATNFPTSLDSLTNPSSGDSLSSPSHSGQHADANDAIEALQAKVGVNGSAVTTSLDYKVSASKTITDSIDIAGASSNLVLKYNGTKFIPTAETSSSGASYVVFDDLNQPNAPDLWVAVSEIRSVTWTGSSWSVGSVIDRVGPSGPGYTLVGTARQPMERYKVIPYNQVISHNFCATAGAFTSFGSTTTTTTGTQSAVVAAQNSPNANKLTSAATAGATAGTQSTIQIACIGSSTDWATSGFDVRWTLRFNDSSYNNTGASTGSRIAVGMSSGGSIATVLASDNLANSFVGFVRRNVNGGSTDTNWQLLCRTGAAGPTTYDTGVAFAAQKWYTLRFWIAPGGTSVGWKIQNHTDGTSTNGTWTPASNLPAAATMLAMFAGLITVDATARTLEINHGSIIT
jgi:hypothetical protein